MSPSTAAFMPWAALKRVTSKWSTQTGSASTCLWPVRTATLRARWVTYYHIWLIHPSKLCFELYYYEKIRHLVLYYQLTRSRYSNKLYQNIIVHNTNRGLGFKSRPRQSARSSPSDSISPLGWSGHGYLRGLTVKCSKWTSMFPCVLRLWIFSQHSFNGQWGRETLRTRDAVAPNFLILLISTQVMNFISFWSSVSFNYN